ncbi:MAG: phospholipase D-like domain-containing protein [Chloroflexota bacterium]
MNKRGAGIGGILLVLLLVILSAVFGVDLLSISGGGSQPLPDFEGDTQDVVREPEEVVPEEVETVPDWYEIYFTNPSCPPEEERTGGLDQFIAEDLATAEVQVDIAAFDLDAEPIVQALINLEDQGIVVRVVTDEDNSELSSINRLRRNGISVIEDKRTALMHNKFIVIDGRYVWMGSLNFTTNGVYCNNNNLVRFDSPELAANYMAEMDEMYDGGEFGPKSPENTPNEKLVINGISVENYFAPEKELAPVIARTIASAQDEILFMTFTFTNDQIGEALLGRADAGTTVRGVFETTGSELDFSYYVIMQEAGLPNVEVRQDGNNRIMHHKVIIVDRETVIFGSFNFSDNANRRNDENIIIVRDPTFTSFFVEEFGFVWDEAIVE